MVFANEAVYWAGTFRPLPPIDQLQSIGRFHASQLSDGTLRFICLATALLQPFVPSTLVIDEPELGLHPYALVLLASLVKEAAQRTQIILCTQSAQLLNEFGPEDVIVATHEAGASRFDRPDPASLKACLQDYTLGELWQKKVKGGSGIIEQLRRWRLAIPMAICGFASHIRPIGRVLLGESSTRASPRRAP